MSGVDRRPSYVRETALAWLVLGLWEAVAVAVVPGALARAADREFLLDWRVSAGLLVLYGGVGAVLGSLVGAALAPLERQLPARRARSLALAVAAWTAMAGFAIHFLVSIQAGRVPYLGRTGMASLGLPPLIVLAWAMLDGARAPRGLRAALHPWAALGLLLGLVWLTRDLPRLPGVGELPLGVTAAAAAGLAFALGLGAALLQRVASARRWLLIPTTALVLALCAGTGRSVRPALPAPPGRPPASETPVVLVVLDTVRADHLSLYGYARDTDPQLRRFAEGATVFREAIMPGDFTLPSHASMFTGQHVSRHRAHTKSGVLPDEARTLAEILGGSGLATAAVLANCGWLAESHGMAQGFAYYDARCGTSPFLRVPSWYLRELPRRWIRRRFFPERASWRWRDAGEITDEAVVLLDHLSGSPFLLFVNYMDAHRPLHPPPPFDTRFPGRDEGFDMQRDWSRLLLGVPKGATVSERDRAHIASQYDGAIAYMDAELGRLFRHLAGLELFDRSLILITSDHGTSFGEPGFGARPAFGHGQSVYQDVVAVPLLVKLPQQRTGRVRTDRASGLDLLPTVLDVLGLPPEPDAEGRSLAGPPADRPLYAESFADEGPRARAVFAGSEKLILHADGGSELYDLARDPQEEDDLAASRADTANALREDLERWAARADASDTPALDEAARERLRELGYIR